jgi:hypothetical protein
LGDARFVILLGHEPPPQELGEVTAVPITPGAPPPTPAPYTPTIPPVRTDPCPSKPYDRFMAEMHYADVTVVINGTLFYGGQEGKLFGASITRSARKPSPTPSGANPANSVDHPGRPHPNICAKGLRTGEHSPLGHWTRTLTPSRPKPPPTRPRHQPILRHHR